MNYRANAITEFTDLAKQYPEYSFGKLLFSFMQKLGSKNDVSLSFLWDISDEDFYTTIEKSRDNEKEL